MEDVKRLRYEGRWEEAEDILFAFRQCCEKNKRQLRKEIIQKDKMIIYYHKKNNNICVYGHCKNSTKKRKYCEKHRKYTNEKNKKSRLKKFVKQLKNE